MRPNLTGNYFNSNYLTRIMVTVRETCPVCFKLVPRQSMRKHIRHAPNHKKLERSSIAPSHGERTQQVYDSLDCGNPGSSIRLNSYGGGEPINIDIDGFEPQHGERRDDIDDGVDKGGTEDVTVVRFEGAGKRLRRVIH